MTNHDNSNAGFAILTTLVTSVGPNSGGRPKSQLRVGSSIERKIRSTSEWFMLIGDRERDHCGCEHIWESRSTAPANAPNHSIDRRVFRIGFERDAWKRSCIGRRWLMMWRKGRAADKASIWGQ
jgi:hypothetical protein